MGKEKSNCWNVLEQLNPVHHLKARLVLAFAATTILLSILLLVVISFTVEKTIRDNVGRQLGELAIQTADKLDRGMFERQRDIYLASNLPIYRDPSVNVSEQRNWLNKERDSLGYYAWIGFTNSSTGIVRAATDGILEGVNVTSRDWFQNALKHDAFIGDVHNAILLATILKNTSTEPLRFIDVAYAVKDQNNVTIGVLGAHIYSTYFREVESSILDSRVPVGTETLREQSIEMYILNSEKVIISAPITENLNTTALPMLNMSQIQSSIQNNEFYFESEWPGEDEEYVIGISDCIGYRTYAGLKWIILMRQPKSIAYASLLKVQLQIGLIGAGLALIFSVVGFVIATKIVNPILKIVNSASRIMSDLPSVDSSYETISESPTPTRDLEIDLERSPSKDDVGILFESLRNLVRSLDKEQELKVLNGKLEKKVRERTVELTTANQQLEIEVAERGLTEAILNNMMPQSIVTRIKKGERVIADQIENITVFFSDIVGFTDISSSTSAPEMVDLLNELFSIMDELAAKHQIEKIKTIGDAYFAVAGLFPIQDVKKEDKASVYASKVMDFSIDVFNALDQFNNSHKFKVPINFRVGVHSGPAVAGIIGFKKPFFDLWGDTINTASRMEHYGSPGRIHVSHATYELTSHLYEYDLRGEIEVKGKGEMRTYWLIRKKKSSSKALTKVASLFNL